ncbi:NupC/NupG family nucleoside CNT transporter [Marininema halotolerans]|uniref:NupC/NupG family nucleoside CNT transporter n=1 Tax=Marininema halotolerans TaxID=1155944 RepID=UPI000B89F13A|nr:NupC/NupG family nucleoside CNT transporter [Marininema halotolerans]
MNFLWGLAGILGILFITYLFSNNKRIIPWRTVVLGLAIQFTFAFMVLKWSAGQAGLKWFSARVTDLIDFSNVGIQFLFDGLVTGKGGPIFALQVLPVIIFLGALIGILYHWGIIQWIIRILGGAIAYLLGTSRVESLSSIATVFLGQSEAPLLIRPYIPSLTSSELFTIMTNGFTSVAGSTLISYALLGIPLPYLLTASVMAAPAGLVISKLMYPETKRNETAEQITMVQEDDTVNVIDAAAKGALDGLRLAVNVGALLLAFISLIALFNGLLGFVGSWFGYPGLTFQTILGYILSPIAFLIGVPWSEAITAGSFIGQKVVINEFVAYSAFGKVIDNLSPITGIIITFALCGFANFSSIAIQIGTIGGLAPSRRSDVARFGLKALLAGTLANLLNATIAGMLMRLF